MVITIGIDPSSINRTTYGAITVLKNGALDSIIRLDNQLETINEYLTSSLACDYTHIEAYIEKVWAMRGQAASGSFYFGEGYGMLQAIMILKGIPITYVTPQKWQKHYAMKKGKEETKSEWKGRLCTLASEFFPETKLLKSVCDSLLIAKYGYEHHRKTIHQA